MVYTPNTEAQRQEMLSAMGLNSLDELYREVPPQVLNPKIDLPAPLSEPELTAEMRKLSELNADAAPPTLFDNRRKRLVAAPARRRCKLVEKGEIAASEAAAGGRTLDAHATREPSQTVQRLSRTHRARRVPRVTPEARRPSKTTRAQ